MAAIPSDRAGGEVIVWFLDTIAYSEGTDPHSLTRDHGYDVIVTGVSGPDIFSDYSDHPFANGRIPTVVRRVPLLTSTASGRYQILLRTWRSYRAQMSLPDFSPLSQDLVAIQIIKERGSISKILSGDIEGAIFACSNIWASFPGNAYGQGGKKMSELLNYYDCLSQNNGVI